MKITKEEIKELIREEKVKRQIQDREEARKIDILKRTIHNEFKGLLQEAESPDAMRASAETSEEVADASAYAWQHRACKNSLCLDRQ